MLLTNQNADIVACILLCIELPVYTRVVTFSLVCYYFITLHVHWIVLYSAGD